MTEKLLFPLFCSLAKDDIDFPFGGAPDEFSHCGIHIMQESGCACFDFEENKCTCANCVRCEKLKVELNVIFEMLPIVYPHLHDRMEKEKRDLDLSHRGFSIFQDRPE